jgi:GNAT superfamily N-acetyltransferase
MNAKIVVRRAIANERAKLEDLQRRASLNNPGDRDAILANPDAIDLPSSQLASGAVRVAELDGVCLGFSVVLQREDGDAELDGLFVEPDVWRSGVGRAFVDHASEQARELGASILHVVGNPHAEGFYTAVGFTTHGTFETRFGTGLLMRKALSVDVR